MSRNNSQKLEERRERLLQVIETEFSSNADFCREMDLSHNWVNYYKNEEDPPKIHDRLLSSLYELKNINPLWVINGVGEKKIFPDQPRKNETVPEDYIAKFMQVRRLIASIEQKPDAVKENAQLDDLAVQCSELTTKLLKLRRSGSSESDL